jgi:precorrin-4 methylase
MSLEEIVNVIEEARDDNKDVARVHTGDPSIYRGNTGANVRAG